MSAVAIEWIGVLLFLLLLVAITAAEIFWIKRKGWTTTGKAVIFVLASNIAGFGLGTFFVLTVLMATLMMVFGPSGQGSNAPDAAYWAAIAAAVVAPPVILILSKRLGLFLFKIASGSRAWAYSFACSLLILLLATIPPATLIYLLWYVLEWK